MRPMCEINESLVCIDCKNCQKDTEEIILKDYIIGLIDQDIERTKDSIRIFEFLTHYTKEQEQSAYKTIFKIQKLESLKKDFIELCDTGVLEALG
ncbi:hypothetical protein FGU46_03155 [Methanobacterium sp. CWC-01]|uniref:hypothetical protein n=1 Tax=Methanobacterium aridiramus TaxID=2584467 RepID=UPI002574E42E|nr:hypothetical protein [Methanobacterium sp. CWC-01]WJI09157.1 hypothetical protein FGU46_03155 [Methanobacterium sp. CWC-01]